MYGPTETTIWSSVYRVSEESSTTVPIGRPIANTQFYIVGEDLQPVVPGEEGQLLIGGDGLARGYKNRPDLTQQKFIPDPFRKEPGARLYKTGDIVRYSPQGTIAFLGRIDDQVKVRGFRIELGEIESVLGTHPSVQQCVVVAREEAGEKRLFAYIVPSPVQKPESRVLREFLKTQLPEYMVPAGFVLVQALPLTPNGKIDRRALPAPSRENSAMDAEVVPARDELERKLVAIWESILKIRPIGIKDDIFDLGVDSVLAAELFARIEKTVGRKLPPGPLFQAPTIEALAALLRRGETERKWTSLVAIQAQGSKPPLFCVHGGAGTVLLFNSLARHLAPERPVYGLQARGLYGRDLPHTNVEEMAAHYIKEMRSVQPKGPYLIGGWCFGGVVAYEIAQQLKSVGEQVDLLVMFNAPSGPEHYAIKPGSGPISPAPPWRRRLQKHWRDWSNVAATEKVSYITRRIRGKLQRSYRAVYRHCRGVARRTLCRFYIALRLPLPDEIRNYYFLYINTMAECRYRPQLYSGNMLIFRDQGPYKDETLGWDRFVTGEIECYEVPVSVNHHRALMQEPVIRTVARQLEEYLARRSQPVPPVYLANDLQALGSRQTIESNAVQ
jgi:aspartate racemase